MKNSSLQIVVKPTILLAILIFFQVTLLIFGISNIFSGKMSPAISLICFVLVGGSVLVIRKWLLPKLYLRS
jgi:hypothetical protein